MQAIAVLLALVLLSACGEKKKAPTCEIEKTYTRGPLELKVSVSKKSVTIAERLTLVLEATAGAATEVDLPRFGEKLEQFGIVDYDAPPPRLIDGGRAMTRRTYTLEPFLSGEYKIPPMTVRFRDKGQGAASHEIQTDEFSIQVKSLLPADVKKLDIKDVAGPVPMLARMNWKVTLAAVLAVALLGVAGTFWWWRKRRARVESLLRTPAHEIAYAELERLLQEGFIEKGEIKAFYNGVSGVLRHYIENRFGLRAPERTTEEFLEEMEQSDLLESSWKTILGRFLSHCDMVKFAEFQPANKDIQNTFDTCKDFIEATRERAPQEAPAASLSGSPAP